MKKETLLITGAAGAIGRATARRLAKKQRVVVADRNIAGAEALARELNDQGLGVVAAEVDVRCRDSVHRMRDWISKEIGPIGALFNSAGVRLVRPVADMSDADWNLVMETHVKGAYLCAQAFLPQMCERRRGVIVNSSSDFAVVGGIGMGAHAAAMTAVYSLTKTLAREFGPHGIRVNALGAGPIDLPPSGKGSLDGDSASGGANIPASVPMGRRGHPDEVAAVLEFLVSDRSAYITGQLIQANGGAVCW
jgi:NAD(P)-dependent dehydrogenase (short-subunit alcohol dehydrogenase family)